MLRSVFVLCFALGSLFAQTTTGVTVRFKTNLGNIDVLLLPGSAPKTVENFLKYVDSKAYDNSVFHRSVKDFIIQGGGFQATLPNLPAIAQNAAVVNEYRESNLRGTIAMAKLDGNPDSATNQWFFNLSNNNAAILNNQNGGFTVFGRVVDNASLIVMDRIAAVPIPSPSPLSSPFNEIPLQNYSGTLTQSNLIVVESITRIETGPPPTISSGGIVTASAFGGYTAAAPGSYLEIFGSNLSDTTVDWSSSFTNGVAPTSLGGVSATVGGQRAFISFVSPTQVNLQIPSTVSTQRELNIVLTAKGQTTAAYPMRINNTAGGLLAPASFRVNGRQYVYATKGNTGTVVSNGTIPGLPTANAAPGDVLVLYGTGFGTVSPFSVAYAGAVADRVAELNSRLSIRIDGIEAQILYQGIAPGFVGLYQFNIVVPPDVTSGDKQLVVTQNGVATSQTLFIPVQR